MSKTITVQIPDELYRQMQGAATASDSPLEAVIVEMLRLLFQGSDQIDPDNLLAHMAWFSDDQLWAVANRRLTKRQSERLHELRDKTQHELLDADEEAEFDELLVQVDRDLLLRSEAYRLLLQRGYELPALEHSA